MKNLMQTLGKSKMVRSLVGIGAMYALGACGTPEEYKADSFREFHGRASRSLTNPEDKGRWVELRDAEAKGILTAESTKYGDWVITNLKPYSHNGDYRSLIPYANQDSLDLAHSSIMGE